MKVRLAMSCTSLFPVFSFDERARAIGYEFNVYSVSMAELNLVAECGKVPCGALYNQLVMADLSFVPRLPGVFPSRRL
jgi:hypothetical protein